jgi:5-methylcytosine-specific restriction endonuclease McrA
MKRRSIPEWKRAIVRYKTGGHCFYCARPLKLFGVHVDHAHPVARGGTNDLENLIASCGHCNRLKQAMTVDEFRVELGVPLFFGEREDIIRLSNAVAKGKEGGGMDVDAAWMLWCDAAVFNHTVVRAVQR